MNPHLLVCLLVSALTGIGVAAVAVLAGWGAFPALLAYMATGSLGLLAAVSVSHPGVPSRHATERQVRSVAEERALVRA